jgi:hypothetical protein
MQPLNEFIENSLRNYFDDFDPRDIEFIDEEPHNESEDFLHLF